MTLHQNIGYTSALGAFWNVKQQKGHNKCYALYAGTPSILNVVNTNIITLVLKSALKGTRKVSYNDSRLSTTFCDMLKMIYNL